MSVVFKGVRRLSGQIVGEATGQMSVTVAVWKSVWERERELVRRRMLTKGSGSDCSHEGRIRDVDCGHVCERSGLGTDKDGCGDF